MNRCRIAVGALALLLSLGVAACAQAPSVYLESFRKGKTRVTEQAFGIDLDPASPTCQIRIKDQSGLNRYALSCTPERVGQGDNRILGWQMRLMDLHHKIYANLLMATPDPAEDKTQIGWLDPGKFAKIPMTAKRVVKVDGFYCVLQVPEYHFTAPPAPYLDHVTVNVKFTNTNPQSSTSTTNK